ncbi:lon protease [Brucella abortus 01-4165]|uniref:Lon protease n=4 Tax=Brucella abortus TaxID=235 RepID=LON_BRUA2|nr:MULTISPECIES: endopeptidase La [Brucella]P0C113.1 RecName: Full=Lon protease; AltName: Full=ATP-dependent protease La [Brucella abortus bv. 1 str. 9-941]Q2YPX3.1 RecName: Full=Lon protease; AltName: Full=ATP-dependent protease La [Brucella abortus 2308]KFH20423.1 DNA-binding protein [Brucella abortus LMN1]KFH21075.1 DNA-binding protein [Brucella abortus LMN2]AAX74453.1 Lon, ATP-dependent protease La [Brucella abortus bv. 1 str. 9-941]ACD72555.1 Lon, ATP-dependent protease La [Brucella abor
MTGIEQKTPVGGSETGGADGLYAVLPLRDIVVFPHMIVPLFVGREKSIRALEEVMGVDKQILLATQKNAADDDPAPDAIYEIGTIANVLQLLKLPDGTVKVLVEGTARAKISKFTDREDYHEAYAAALQEPEEDAVEIEALARSVVPDFENYVKLNKKISPEVVGAASQIDDYSKLADTVASHLAIKIPEKQEMLSVLSVRERLEKALSFMEAEISVLQVEKRIRSRVKRQMEKTQREYYLNEQMKAIQKELGDSEDGRDEVAEIEERITKTKLSKEAREKALAELKKLRSMSPMSAEATVVRNYLDWLLSIPWGKKSKVKQDLNFAQEVLDAEHFGLGKVKERIVEYLAVQARSTKIKGPILCLVGPPGVGKTSLARSIAKATGREYVRMSLGGVRDEAEIRGHRRTYIGSMPGKVIQSMKKAKKSNPLFLLDEIDKMGQDFRGDPSSAMLEVLDPEQNATFMDHYLEVEYDLSNVMFVTTANTMNIPVPLLDRMEIIRIAGYTEDEKLEIAKRHLLPKAIKDHALQPKEFSVTEDALRNVIRHYTREAGVRSLEREVMTLARKAVTEILKTKKKSVKITDKNLSDYLGVEKFRFGQIDGEDQVGVVTGLAWTEVGGELLTIEGVMMPGKGRMTVTGNLRDVMKESISAAASYVRSRAIDFGIEPPLFDKRDIHVHVPEGATPKDGPSAGIAMVTAIVSVLTGIPVRKDIAMTGEVTLRGRVLPIGGLKEKLLATLRGGIKKVLIPEENAKDLAEIPDNVKNNLEIVPVSRVGEVLKHALVRQPEPIEWTEQENPTAVPPVEDEAGASLAH